MAYFHHPKLLIHNGVYGSLNANGPHIFEYLIPNSGTVLEKIIRCGYSEGDVSLGVGAEVAKAYPCLSFRVL